jgi:hypothetical protein
MFINIQGDSSVDGNGYRVTDLFYFGNGTQFILGGNASVSGIGLYLWDGLMANAVINATFGYTLTKNTWYHIALSRQGSVFRIFLDGIMLAETWYSGSLGTSSAISNIAGWCSG